jgi:hypothetical protein
MEKNMYLSNHPTIWKISFGLLKKMDISEKNQFPGLVMTHSLLLKFAIEIVDFPMNGD